MTVKVTSENAELEDIPLVEFPSAGMNMRLVRYACHATGCGKIHAGLEVAIIDSQNLAVIARAVIGLADLLEFVRNLRDGAVEVIHLKDYLDEHVNKEN